MDLHHLPLEFASASGTVRWTKFGSGPPMVFNHGTPFSSFVWRDIAQSFSSTHTVYLWDMPGYGQSDMYDNQDVSLGAQGHIFTALLASWGLQDENHDNSQQQLPIVIAHDFGGCVALRARLLHGAKYKALALVDPVAMAPWGSPFFRLVRDNAHVFTQLPPELHRGLIREYIAGSSHQTLHPQALDALVAPWVTVAGRAAFYRQIAQADQRYTDEIETRYAELTGPVMVCWGTDDAWIPLERGRELARRIPGVALKEIPGAGHLVQLDKPAQLTGLLTQFVNDLYR